MRRHHGLVLALCIGALVYACRRWWLAPARAPTPLNAYLRASRAALTRRTGAPPLVLICGNEAGDLDSAASAIALSYAITHEWAFFARLGLPRGTYVPVLQTARRDLALRRENLAVYAAVGIDVDALVTIDDVRAAGAHTRALVGLVDHAALAPSWGAAHVVLIVDHHADVGAHPEARLRAIYPPATAPVGSASSLVARLYRDALGGARAPDRQVADLLLSAGVIDTRNYRAAPDGKATAVDLDARAFLAPASSLARTGGGVAHVEGSSTAPLDAWNTFLQDAKSDVRHLSALQLLARDYKEGTAGTHRFGIAAAPVGLSELLADAGWWPAVHAWMAERAVDTLLVMLSSRPTKKRVRELVLVGRADIGALARALEDAHVRGTDAAHPDAAHTLGLERADTGPLPPHTAAWRQRNTKANRKIVQPLLERLLAR